MRRVFRILVPLLVIAGLIGGWAALRANRRTLSYDAIADRAGFNRRIAELRWDGPTLQSATDDLQRLAGIRIKFSPDLASRVTDDWLAMPLPIHADLHDVSVRTALGLVTRAASAASNYSPDLTMDPRADGIVWLLDDSDVPRVVRIYDVRDLLSELTSRPEPGPPQPNGTDNLLRLMIWMSCPNSSNGIHDPMTISSGRLIVYATAEMQAEVAHTLEAFRAPMAGPDQLSHIVSKLDAQIEPLAIHGQPLTGAIDRLGKEAGVNLVVEWASTVGAHLPDASARIDFHRATSRELGPMPLRAVIPRLFRISQQNSAFHYAADGSVLLVMQEVPPQLRLARAYDVRDLVSHFISYEQSHEYLANGHPPGKAADYTDQAMVNVKYLVEHVVTTEAWYENGGSNGDMIAGNGTLFVVSDADQQRQVARALAELRQIENSTARPVPPEFLQPCEDVFAKLSIPIPELRLDNVTLDEALAVLARDAGVSIEADPPLHDPYHQTLNRVTLRLWNVQLHAALQEVLRQAGDRAPLSYGIADGVLVVAARGSETPVTRAYDVRDLVEKWIAENPFVDILNGPINANFRSPADGLFPQNRTTPALEQIERILYDMVDEPSWKEDGGNTGQISVFAGLLIITQSPENHLRIEALLNVLRS